MKQHPGAALRVGGPATAAEAKEQVATACRIVARFGHVDLTLGHVSVKGPDGDTIYIKGKGKALGEVTPEDVIEVRLDDQDGHTALGAHLETAMHLEAYRARPDIGAAIHTHPVYGIALGATTARLEFVSHDAVLFRDGLGRYGGNGSLVTTPEEGHLVAEALGSRRAVLLQNHGVLAVGEDVRWAVLAALTLERAIQLQMIAKNLGDLVPMDQAAVESLYPVKYPLAFVEEYWDAWCRADGDGSSEDPR
ncbi:MAG: class II aldolase/adducin family protein [Candidatus Dormibacteria bacterium]